MRPCLFISGLGALIAALTACGAPAECGPEQCAEHCERAAPSTPAVAASVAAPAPAKASGLTDFEKQHVDPILADLRAGVRPWDDASVGICTGQGRECDAFVGTDPQNLPPGKYMLRGEFRVPKVGEWKVKLDTECTLTKRTDKGETSTTSSRSKEYDVHYISEERGSRLSPLYNIESPNPHGEQRCTWTLTAPHPDGDKVYSGSWSVPQKG